MAKVNTGRKSDSWRPGMVTNGSGMISKNQKRKEKRLSHNLSVLKSQVTPGKKSSLGPMSKFKENLNQSLNLPSLGKKENKLLSTSLPIKGDKQSTPSLKKNAKPTGILSNSNTPKLKGSNKVTFNMDKNVKKFIDNEAEEGEEPVTDKVVKPYEKGSQQKQQMKRKMSMMDIQDSEEEDSESDDESFDSASQFVDMEASEGEETDSVDDEESDDENSDDDFLTGDSDEESGDEMESADEEAEEDSEEEAEDESEDESEEEMAPANSGKIATPNRRESMVAIKKEKAESTPLPKKEAVKVEPVTPQSKKVDVKIESTPQSKKQKIKIESEQKKATVKAEIESKKENVAAKTPVKGKTEQATVENQSQEKVKKREKKVEETLVGEKSPFVGFIRKISAKVNLNDVKSALSKKIDAKKIVGLRLARDRNVFVYLNDEDTLELLLNNSFVVNENSKFVVYKARDSAGEKQPKFVAFLPKVPLTKTVAEVQNAVAKCVGADCVEKVKFRKVFKRFQTRHVLVQFTDVESLKKIVKLGELQIGSDRMVIRPAYETTVDVPNYKVLFTSIPEKTTEAMLKKAIESQVGKDTVQTIQFSQKKASFAYVTMKTEEARKKTLEVGKNVTINGTKLEVEEFKAHKPEKKRAAPSEQAKERKKNKAKKQKLADGTASPTPSGKKNKAKNASPKTNVQNSSQQTPSKVAAAQSKPKNEVQNSTGPEVAAKPKKNKQFPKPGKGANANQQPQSPVKGPAPQKSANQKQEPQSPANGPAPGKGAISKKQQKKLKKDAASPKSQSPNPVNVSVNGASPSNRQQKKKNKNKQQQQQQSPKPVDAKKQALVAKIASKKKNKKNSMKQNAS